jgi:hypothetical protein
VLVVDPEEPSDEAAEDGGHLHQERRLFELLEPGAVPVGGERVGEPGVVLPQRVEEGLVEGHEPPHPVEVGVLEPFDAERDVPGARLLAGVLGQVLEGHPFTTRASEGF